MKKKKKKKKSSREEYIHKSHLQKGNQSMSKKKGTDDIRSITSQCDFPRIDR